MDVLGLRAQTYELVGEVREDVCLVSSQCLLYYRGHSTRCWLRSASARMEENVILFLSEFVWLTSTCQHHEQDLYF